MKLDNTKKWNQLSKYFDTSNHESMSSDAADNIYLAWPVILKIIKKEFKKMSGLNALDFGCGAGAFCLELSKLKINVTGIDSAKKLIVIAKNNHRRRVKFVVGNERSLPRGNFDLIVSVMVLGFIKNITVALKQLVGKLKPGGLLVFAVHNPAYVRNCLKKRVLFKDFKSASKFTAGKIMFKNISLPVYIRTAKEYGEICGELGLKKVAQVYPPFTKAFLAKFKVAEPTTDPEHMILGFRKYKGLQNNL